MPAALAAAGMSAVTVSLNAADPATRDQLFGTDIRFSAEAVWSGWARGLPVRSSTSRKVSVSRSSTSATASGRRCAAAW